jgi:hypothetical protein
LPLLCVDRTCHVMQCKGHDKHDANSCTAPTDPCSTACNAPKKNRRITCLLRQVVLGFLIIGSVSDHLIFFLFVIFLIITVICLHSPLFLSSKSVDGIVKMCKVDEITIVLTTGPC